MSRTNPRKRKYNRSKTRPAAARVSYDHLEPRLALTTFMVTGAGDDASGVADGIVTLREAIIAANTNAAFGDAPAGDANGDAIRFDSSLAGSTITLTEGQFSITDDVLIQGGGNNITIDADGNSRIAEISTNERVSLSRLTLTGGNAAIGGAVSSIGGGTTIVFAAMVNNNVATGLGGGGLYNAGGNLFVTDTTVSDNLASGASGSGGAILSASGVALVRGGSLTSNTANRAGGAVEVIDGSFYLSNTLVGGEGTGNVAGPVGSASPGNGGGLHVTGAATVAIKNTDISFNYAAREGGGLWNQAGSRMFVNADTVVSFNLAAGNDADDGGGGIFNNNGDLYVNSATIADNQALGEAGSGGGIFSTGGRVLVFDSTIDGNAAARAGGGIELIDGFQLLSNSIVSNNDAGVTLTAAPGNGGALHVSGAADVLIKGGEITGNSAAREGGGLWNQAGSSMFLRDGLEISGNTASGNDADDGGGGIFNNGGNLYITDIMIGMNVADGTSGSGGGIFSTDGKVNITDSTIDGNAAARAGGGVEAIDGFVGFFNTTVSNNDAGVTITAAPGNGGGLHITGTASTVVRDGSFSGNVAANQGGGLWNQLGANMFINNGATITGNSATGSNANGGGVYNKGYLSAVDSFFQMNGAVDGGGIFGTSTARTIVNNSSFLGNTAGSEGGGIFNDGFSRVVDSAFTSNVATVNGGGVFTSQNATTTFNNNTFSGNLPNNQN